LSRRPVAGQAARRYRFYRSCVGWPPGDVDSPGGLSDLIRLSVQITRATFIRYVQREDLHTLEAQLGYQRRPHLGLTMAGDWHVTYFRSKHHGIRVYGFTHSAIEYVFKRFEPDGRVVAVQRTIPFPEFAGLGRRSTHG